MRLNKDRLYVALYIRGGTPTMPAHEDKYHWALLVGPKAEDPRSRGARFHAKNIIVDGQLVWQFQEEDITMMPTTMLLVRVMIAKIKDRKKLKAILRRTPVRPQVQGWNCVYWVKEALEKALQTRGVLGTLENASWDLIRRTAVWYVETKEADHRFDGKGYYNPNEAPTWDMIEGVERTR
ncbi:hypothetical protein E4U41_005120 [Claviceps citrina]|nr:hypothetical protein E4U41_005120 [Claviceps citrina]